MEATSRASLAAAHERLDALARDGAGTTDFADVADGLFSVGTVLGRAPGLQRALTDTSRNEADRVGLLEGLFGTQLSPLPLDAVRGLVRTRWSRPGDLTEAIETLAVQAMFAAAEASGVLDDVEDELFRFGRVIEREPALRAALLDPGLPADRKVALLDALLEGKARPATRRLLTRVVTDPRGRSIDAALDELIRLAAARRQRLVAQVQVAAPLDPEQSRRLATSLARIYGRDVQLQVEVDPGVLGGVLVRVGDEVIDGSITHRLDEVARRLGPS